MPLPKPKKNESRDTYVARFMQSTEAKEFKTIEQRLGVAYSQWRESKKKKE